MCDFSTKIEHQLSTHMTLSHKKNFPCKFWMKGKCTKVDCLYKHEIVWCKFDQHCRNRNCKFEHRQPQTEKQNINPWLKPSTRQSINPWLNPAYVNRESYNTNLLNMNIKERTDRGRGAVHQISQMLDNMCLGKFHFEAANILRNSLLLSSLISNSESWYNVTLNDITKLE